MRDVDHGKKAERTCRATRHWSRHPAWIEFVRLVLDKRDRTGRFPKSITCGRSPDGGLERCVPPAALRTRDDGRLLIDLQRIERILAGEAADLSRPPESLEDLFDRLAGRRPRDLRTEADLWEERLRASIERGVREGRERALRAGGTRPWLTAAQVDRNPGTLSLLAGLTTAERVAAMGWRKLAREAGMDAVEVAVARLVAAFIVARHHQRGALRLDHLSLALTGATKSLRPGSPDHLRLTRALLDADPKAAEEIRAAVPRSAAQQRRRMLERLGIVTNDAPLEVLLQGPLHLEVEGERLTDVAKLAELGLPAKLTYGLMRRARPRLPAGTRVVTVENESAFHTLAAHWTDDLLIFTGGQSAWSLVLLLTRLRESDATLRFRHAGDLDRSGVLILRSLRARTGLTIDPLWMDAETFDRCSDLAVAMAPAERQRTRKLLDDWNDTYGRDLLARLAESGRWVEQEAVLERVLGTQGLFEGAGFRDASTEIEKPRQA